MMPDNNSEYIPRGRTQTAKPLTTAGASLTAPTASTRAKTKPQAQGSRTITASTEKRPAGAPKVHSSSSVTNGTPKTKRMPHQVMPMKKTEVPEASTRLKSQPLKQTVRQDPLERSTLKETTGTATALEDPQSGKYDVSEDDGSTQPQITSVVRENDIPQTNECESLIQSDTVVGTTPSCTIPSTANPLQVAAQTYPWLYMSSTLDACFEESKETAKRELGELEDQIIQEEKEFEEEKIRYENERLIEFCDELGSESFAKEAPAIMQSFMSFGENCERVEAEALQLAMNTPSLESEEPLQAYSTLMEDLDRLQEQATELESSILCLTETGTNSIATTPSVEPGPSASSTNQDDEIKKEEEFNKADANSARAQIIGVFAACLPVVRARKANLLMAQELIDSAQENLSLALRMESLGID